MRAFAFAAILCLAACATDELPVPPIEPPRPVIQEPPVVVTEAAKAKAAAEHYIEKRPDLSAADLIRLLDLSQGMQNAVRKARSHPTRANTRAAKVAIDALRGFIAR